MSLQDQTTYRRRRTGSSLTFFKKTWIIFGSSPAKKLRQVRLLLSEQPEDVDLRLRLASLLADEGRNEEAIVEWCAAKILLPSDSDVEGDELLSQRNARSHYILGVILHNKGLVPQAIEEWDKASDLDAFVVGDLARSRASAARNSGYAQANEGDSAL